jgi:succinate-acetate transporter protein
MSMTDSASAVTFKDITANPGPLGLMGFGMTTALLNFHNAGFFGLDAPILTMGIFYGGLAQLLTGMLEWKKGNTFGTVAFTSYGAFWLTLVGVWLLPKMGWNAPDPASMTCYLALWGFFTLLLFFGTLKTTLALQVVFGTLTVLFFLLAGATATGSEALHHFAGWEGIVCGFSAIYTAIAQILNEMYGRTVLPLGPSAH